jgi:hypothetical protein
MNTLLDRSPESLTLAERRAAAGLWFAFEVYTPQNLALREIRAVGDSPAACAASLKARGLDPLAHEFVLQAPPFH